VKPLNSPHQNAYFRIPTSVRISVVVLWLIAVGITGVYSINLTACEQLKEAQYDHYLIELAHRAINEYMNQGQVILSDNRLPDAWPGGYTGVFITLMKNGRVRGCIGSFTPLYATLEQTIIQTAIRALYQDDRSPPIERSELNSLQIIITITGERYITQDPYGVDLMREGLLIRYQEHASVLLPGEARTTSWGIRTMMQQAGIQSRDQLEYYTFQVVTYDERYLE